LKPGFLVCVMPALVVGIHAGNCPDLRTWMVGSSPAMTRKANAQRFEGARVNDRRPYLGAAAAK
jgi:hypothetical protein